MIIAHSDVVGSLLRPAPLLTARDDYAAGRLTPAQFKGIEDSAVDEAIRRGSEIVVMGSPRRAARRSGIFDDTVDFVLKQAPCRVLVVGGKRALAA